MSASIVRRSLLRTTPNALRTFTTSTRRPVNDLGPEKTHVTNKPAADAKTNVHSEASKKGFEDRKTGGNPNAQATTQRDKTDANARAKKENPEAPEPVIGMNEERGRVGH